MYELAHAGLNIYSLLTQIILMTNEEDIQNLEEEIRKTKYNKHTQFHIGQLKAKLARLKMEDVKKSGGKKGAGYSVKKSGDATVLLVGFPSVGKSTLLNKITNAESKVGAYEFTTLDVIPGVMDYNGAKIQILDIPGIIEGASQGKGRGKEILSVLRSADLIIIMSDAKRSDAIRILENELFNAGFRLNKKPPNIVLHKKMTGGIDLKSTVKLTKLTKEMVRSILNEFKINSAEIIIRENTDVDDLIDLLMKNRTYVPCIKIINKIDKISEDQISDFRKRGWLTISAENGTYLEGLKKTIWDNLSLMRIYMKRIGKEPDMVTPLIIKSPATVQDVANKIHRHAFGSKLEYAKIWGKSAKFPGQKIGVEKILQDEDVVELHIN
jgi:small GTP-binding protein